MKNIPRKGSLRKISLPRILISLNRKGKTGTLIVSADSYIKNVYIADGESIFASSSHEDDRLGEMLIKAGLINQAQLTEALDAQQKNGGKLGFNLVKLGFVKEDDITQLLSDQYGVPSINLRHFEIDEAVINPYAPIYVKLRGGPVAAVQ